MRYIDILTLNEDFQPVYNIENERKNGWKGFIPHSRFLDVFSTVLNSLDSKNLKERKSLWMQGEFGTGKTHATAVIEHLLWDDIDEIEDFIENLNNPQLKERIINFRKKNRVFPVILKGASGITDNRTFAFAIECAVKNALKRHGIYVSTESDFERWSHHIRENPLNIDWEKNIYEHQRLKMYVRDKDDLLNKLKEQDIKILSVLEEMSSERGAYFSSLKVTDWLIDVLKELQNQRIASHIVLYWDEFTNILEIEKSSILLTELQNIAELSTTENIYLFVVSHRKPSQTQLVEKELEKIQGRFHILDYPMEELTTYHIISGAIKKKDSARWEGIKRNSLENEGFNKLISRLTLNEGSAIKEAIKNVFPIHPYTAYLATFVARNIGSTERSIFNFLYDEEQGFLKFIKENPGDDLNRTEYFLTADHLWDFFLGEFENSEQGKFGAVISRYKYYKGELEKKGPKYLAVFKGILLLNILTQITRTRESGIELVQPTSDNIKSMFLGVTLDSEIEEILMFIDQKGYIKRTPDGQFIVSIADLPIKELTEEIERMRREGINITSWIKSWNKKDSLINNFTDGILREVECEIYDAGLKEYEFRGRLKNDFKKTYSIHIAIILSKEERDSIQVKKTIEVLSKEFEDLIFVIVEEPLGEKNFSNILDYIARANVARRHQLEEEAINCINYVDKLIEDWLRRIRGSFVTYRLREIEKRSTVSNFSSIVNEELSKEIFRYGLENIEELRKNRNLWTSKKSTKIAEEFLFANNRTDIIEKIQNALNRPLKYILMDKDEYILDESLKLKELVDSNHPLVKISREIENTIKSFEGKEYFHLGVALKFLSEPPYGLYSNMANSAVLALAMRPFVGKLYEIGTGKCLEKEIMRDKIIGLFGYWQENKDRGLEVRLGALEEKELVELLGDIFNTQENNINGIRWRISNWINASGYPLWAIVIEHPQLKEVIDKLLWLLRVTDREITQEDIKELLAIIKENHLDLKLSLTEEALKEGFIRWLKKFPNLEISETDIPEIEKYLKENMQEEIALWQEIKVSDKVKDWYIITGNKRREREFIRAVEEIFRLNSDKSLGGLKLELRRWIDSFGCPLWMFNFGNDKDLEKAIDEFSRIISSNYDISERDIDNLFPVLKEKSTYLQSMLRNRNGKDIFKEWAINKIRDAELDFEEVYNYVRNNASKDVFLWEEERISQLLIELEIFNSLKTLFSINSARNLDELRYRIEEKINALGHPIWAIKNKGNLNEIVDIISELNSMSYDSKRLLAKLRRLSQEDISLFRSVLSRPNMEDNFKRWIKEVQSDIPDKYLSDVMKYLYEEIGKNVWLWSEDKAREKVKDWYIKYRNNGPVSLERIRYMQSKIKLSQKEPKSILLRMVEDHPEICDWIEKYL